MPTLTLTTPDLWLNGPSTVRSVWSPTVSGLPTGAIINSVTLSFYNGHTYASPGYSEVFWGTEPLVAQRLWYYHRGTPNKTITLDLTGRVTGNGTFSLLFYKTKNDAGSNSNVCFQNVSVVIDYTNPRSTFTLSKSSLNAGTALGVTISRIDASYTHKVTFAFGSRSYTATGVATSVSYTIPVAWLDQIPNAVSGTGTVTVETISGSGASMGSVSASFTLTAGAGVVPTVGTAKVELVDGLDGLYIQGHSRCRVTVSGYAAGTGATVASVLITGNGESAWAATMTSGLLRTAGTVTFTVTVKDSRGREASGSVSVTVEAYTDIAITGKTAIRCTSDGTVSRTKGKSAKLGCSYAMTTVGSNAATVRVYWRVYGTEAWTEITGWNSASGYTAVALTDAVALDGRYEFLFRVADRMSMAEQTAVIAPGSVFMVWSKIRNAFGFGAYPTGEKQVAIAEDWRLMLGSTDVGNAIRQRDRVRNLLDNSDFRNPVNQRGAGSYSGAVYSIDRWRSWKSGSAMAIGDGCITLSGDVHHAQYIDSGAFEDGKSYTYAVMRKDGTLYLASAVFPMAAEYSENGMFSMLLTDSDTSYVTITSAGDYVWAALYEGSYTADTLPPYVPKGYAAELAQCKRYYNIIPYDMDDYYVNANTAYPSMYPVSFPEMRIIPTVTLQESWNVGSAGVSVGFITKSSLAFQAAATSSRVAWHGKIKLDADL